LEKVKKKKELKFSTKKHNSSYHWLSCSDWHPWEPTVDPPVDPPVIFIRPAHSLRWHCSQSAWTDERIRWEQVR